jgi:hypothetical protein
VPWKLGLEYFIFCFSVGLSGSESNSFCKTESVPGIEVCGSNFHLYSQATLSYLSFDCLSRIVSSDSVVLTSEDDLLDFILSCGSSYFCLLDSVRFELLNSD